MEKRAVFGTARRMRLRKRFLMSILLRKPLTGKFSDIVYGSDTEWSEHYPTRFRARRAVITHAINIGWTFDDCLQELLRFDNPGSVLWTRDNKGKRLPNGKQYKIIYDDYRVAEKFVLNNPAIYDRTDARQRIGEAIAYARDYGWHGSTGRTDKDVLLFTLERMSFVGSTKINLSQRDIALGAGITPGTA